ncbi:MAG: Mov34/MPN/PAD-1 family protein [Stenomitos frigidus ULC029]
MLTLLTTAIDQIRTHAYAFPDEEVCGLIVDGAAIRCVNKAEQKFNHFTIDAREYLHCDDRGTIQALYHSHCNDNDEFSVTDIQACKAHQLPWILCTKEGQIKLYDPTVVAPYLGREWRWSCQNCYTLFQDWYKQELNIYLSDFYLSAPDVDRNTSVGFLENFEPQGFRRLGLYEPLQQHDVMLMVFGSRIPNHVGVLVDATKNLMLHHVSGRLSEHAPYGDDWRKRTHSVWRYTGFAGQVRG